MALPVTIPNQFANATASIPLSQLDTNFNTLANAVNGISDGSETLANVTATVANITTANVGALNTSGAVVFNDAGADVDFRVESDTVDHALFVEGSSGNVGIGTASPGVRLEVAGASAGSSFNALRMANTDTTASSPVSALFQSADDGTLRNRAIISSGSDGSNNGYVAFNTRLSGSVTERMRIDSSGNALITRGFIPTNTSTLFVRGVSGGSYNTTFSQTNATMQIVSDEMSVDQWYPTFNITMVRQSLTTGANAFGGIGFSTIDDSNNSGMYDAGRIAIVNDNGALAASGTEMAFYTQVGSVTPTNPATEAMRIDSSGSLLVGTTSGNANIRMIVDGSAGAAKFTGDDLNHYQLVLVSKSSSASTHFQVAFINAVGTVVGAITHNDTATTYATSSDYRLKHDIQPMTGALAKVAQLKPVTYKWNADDSQSQGFIAHELQEVAPYAVTGEKDGEQMQGVDYGKITPLLTAALQEAIAEIQLLKARVAELEAK
jgi:hypothetical protein